MGKLLMLTGTPSLQTQTPTCKSRAAESLSPLRWIILCDSTVETVCMPDIYRGTLLPTAASACQSDTRSHFLMQLRSGLPLQCLAERQSIATTQTNRSNRVFRADPDSVLSRVLAFHLRPHLLGGGGKSISPVAVATALWVVCRSTFASGPAKGRWLHELRPRFVPPLSGRYW